MIQIINKFGIAKSDGLILILNKYGKIKSSPVASTSHGYFPQGW